MQATALAVTDEGSHCSARADPSHSGTSMLTARRAPADRFKRDVPALGESPASRAVACRFCLRARFVCAHTISEPRAVENSVPQFPSYLLSDMSLS
eukprot:scaffold79677_cov33-Phaeocystis_antarctica.AAC.1